MAGRPLGRARRRVARSLSELTRVLGLEGRPMVPGDVERAFVAGEITMNERIVLRHHASLGPSEQGRFIRDERAAEAALHEALRQKKDRHD